MEVLFKRLLLTTNSTWLLTPPLNKYLIKTHNMVTSERRAWEAERLCRMIRIIAKYSCMLFIRTPNFLPSLNTFLNCSDSESKIILKIFLTVENVTRSGNERNIFKFLLMSY